MVGREDIAHIAVRASAEEALGLLDQYFAARMYRRVKVEGTAHLLKQVNWDSPFDPLPKYRCFALLREQDGWTTVTDELDLLDEGLAAWLSEKAMVLAVRGWANLEQFEYRVMRNGTTASEDDLDPDVARVLSHAKENPDHVTKFGYDDLNIYFRHPSRRGQLLLVGFMLQ